jgi:hypothetical protein
MIPPTTSFSAIPKQKMRQICQDAGKGGTDDSPHHRLFRHTACKKCAKFVRMQAKVGPMIPPTTRFSAIPPAKNAPNLFQFFFWFKYSSALQKDP